MDANCERSSESATAVRQRVVDCVVVCVRSSGRGVLFRPQRLAFPPLVPPFLFAQLQQPGAACVPVEFSVITLPSSQATMHWNVDSQALYGSKTPWAVPAGSEGRAHLCLAMGVHALYVLENSTYHLDGLVRPLK